MDALDMLYDTRRQELLLFSGGPAGDREHPVFGEGPMRPKLMLIGEAPGREEAQAGRPFVGKAGRQLNDMLSCARIRRDEVYVTNAVKYRPVNVKAKSVSNRTPTPAEIADGLPLLRAEITTIAPSVIATLGNTPLRAVYALTGREKSPVIGAVHGEASDVTIDGAHYTLFPLYHPASGIYRRELIDIMRNDLIKLWQLFGEEVIE